MTSALTSDLAIQGVAIAIALVFAGVMSWRARDGNPLQFTTFLLQAMMCEAALIVIASIIYPSFFSSLLNEKAFVVMIAMMTLIYAVRDIVGSFEKHQSGPDKKADRGNHPL